MFWLLQQINLLVFSVVPLYLFHWCFGLRGRPFFEIDFWAQVWSERSGTELPGASHLREQLFYRQSHNNVLLVVKWIFVYFRCLVVGFDLHNLDASIWNLDVCFSRLSNCISRRHCIIRVLSIHILSNSISDYSYLFEYYNRFALFLKDSCVWGLCLSLPQSSALARDVLSDAVVCDISV